MKNQSWKISNVPIDDKVFWNRLSLVSSRSCVQNPGLELFYWKLEKEKICQCHILLPWNIWLGENTTIEWVKHVDMTSFQYKVCCPNSSTPWKTRPHNDFALRKNGRGITSCNIGSFKTQLWNDVCNHSMTVESIVWIVHLPKSRFLHYFSKNFKTLQTTSFNHPKHLPTFKHP